MSDMKQVKVDNWGIYFLQRLKHFFNRTDYCDLTLQFQDNAQLKVHRLVLNVCTEYFELLERTCEMYEDCLVMPDDLQADVVVPIVNFMYTGQLEFRRDSLDKLYQTSQVMNMPVLTKLLDAHRGSQSKSVPSHNYGGVKTIAKSIEAVKPKPPISASKRSYVKAFETTSHKIKPKSIESNRPSVSSHSTSELVRTKLSNLAKSSIKEKKYSTFNSDAQRPPSPPPLVAELFSKKHSLGDPRPTRYELPEELDTDNIFENSFTNISYESKPLMVHPETSKQYISKRNSLYNEASTSKTIIRGSSTVDIVECKKIPKKDSFFEVEPFPGIHEDEMFQPAYLVKDCNRDPSQLFDQILGNSSSPKVTIESKDKESGNLDHAKIISEVLKKYPHLVKGNKNIKLKILNTTSNVKKTRPSTPQKEEKPDLTPKAEYCYTYETDVLDSKEAAKLIAMGAENVKGPWICLICGTPGKALNFTSYYNFRRHLVEVHNEKPVSTICEYCGLRSYKRNYLLHHIYTKHGVPPPPQYHFPKCNMCDYIALTEGFLIKHKLTHSDTKPLRCNRCSCAFSSAKNLIAHIKKTGHNMHTERKENLRCVYCMKVFLRESNFYVHLKTNHKEAAIRDGRLMEDSDEETQVEEKPNPNQDAIKSNFKFDTMIDNEFEDTDHASPSYVAKSDSNTQVSNRGRISSPNTKHKILNHGFNLPPKPATKPKATTVNEYVQDSSTPQINQDNVVYIDGNEYIMKHNQLIPKKYINKNNEEYIITDLDESEKSMETKVNPSTSDEFNDSHKMTVKKSSSTQPIQIVVSNEEEYKALMSSNHSIIFDDGDSNKTLTVLDSSAIDLNNPQTNDMMIIQEDYPMTVSNSVPADSNYVVVYSNAVAHDPSKEYQIITPQEIGAEYVQAEDVITENYEDVTTSNAVLTSHDIDTQMEESWPEQNTHNQSTVDVLTNEKLMDVSQNTNTSLPNVEEPCQSTEVINNIVTLEQIRESNPEAIENVQTEQVIEEEIQNNEAESMDIDNSAEIITDKESSIPEAENEIEEEIDNGQHGDSLQNVEIYHENTLIHQQELVNEHDPSKISNYDDVGNTVNLQQNPSATIDVNNIKIIQDIAAAVPNKNNSDIVTKTITDQVENITSEWSEDEYETGLEKSIQEKSPPHTEVQTTNHQEVEESIENIQQEMQKQMESSIAEEEDSSNGTGPSLENTNTESSNKDNQGISTVINVEAAQQKISSLLNDWEDNDSQEENGSQEDNNSQDENGSTNESTIRNEESDQVLEPTENATSEHKEEEAVNNDKPLKDDNIKSLVSDWDEEEEEEMSK